MSAKTYCKKTAAVIGWFIQNFPTEVDDAWIGDAEATKTLLASLANPPVKVKPAVEPLYEVVATFSLPSVLVAKTQAECFVGDLWSYRDSDHNVGRYFKKDQPSADTCSVTTVTFNRSWNFRLFAVSRLGAEWNDKSEKELGNEIIRKGLTLTNAQAEVSVILTEGGHETGMCIDGYGNFYFTETGDEENPVAVAYVRRDGRLWDAYVRRLGSDYGWNAVNRFLLRNLEAPSNL